jgi:hypothetical protein
MPNFLTTILTAAKTQLAALLPTIKAIATNSPAPARTTLISTVVLIGIGWVVFKWIGALKK